MFVVVSVLVRRKYRFEESQRTCSAELACLHYYHMWTNMTSRKAAGETPCCALSSELLQAGHPTKAEAGPHCTASSWPLFPPPSHTLPTSLTVCTTATALPLCQICNQVLKPRRRAITVLFIHSERLDMSHLLVCGGRSACWFIVFRPLVHPSVTHGPERYPGQGGIWQLAL